MADIHSRCYPQPMALKVSPINAARKSGEFRKRVAKGVAAVAILISATSIVNTLSELFTIPLSTWFVHAIAAYRALFYPFVDATLGRIVVLCGGTLSHVVKDIIIIYSIVFSAFYRGWSKYLATGSDGTDAEMGASKYFAAIILAAIWPLQAPALLNPDAFIPVMIAANSGDKDAAELLRQVESVHKEILYVVIVVAVALLFNSAGILT